MVEMSITGKQREIMLNDKSAMEGRLSRSYSDGILRGLSLVHSVSRIAYLRTGEMRVAPYDAPAQRMGAPILSHEPMRAQTLEMRLTREGTRPSHRCVRNASLSPGLPPAVHAPYFRVMLHSEGNSSRPSAENAAFVTTHWSVVVAAGHATRAGAREALEKLCHIYWYPLYAYVRRCGHH